MATRMIEGSLGEIREPTGEVSEYEEAVSRAVADGTADFQSMTNEIRRQRRTAIDYGRLGPGGES